MWYIAKYGWSLLSFSDKIIWSMMGGGIASGSEINLSGMLYKHCEMIIHTKIKSYPRDEVTCTRQRKLYQ
jgi:hypothetical protein